MATCSKQWTSLKNMATRIDDFAWFHICTIGIYDFYYNGKDFQKQYRPVVGKATRLPLTSEELKIIKNSNYQEVYEAKKNIISNDKKKGKERLWNNREYYQKRF